MQWWLGISSLIVGFTLHRFNQSLFVSRFLSTPSFIPSTDNALRFEGRWLANEDEGSAVADWPCATIHTRVMVNDPSHDAIRLHWRGVRVRILVRIESEDGSIPSSETILAGPAFDFPLAQPDLHSISFPSEGVFRVSIRKLNNAVPLGMGFANKIFDPSVVRVYGFDLEGDIELLPSDEAPARFLDFIGASDTAGYCVDGTTNMSDVYSELAGWEYDNCDSTSGGDLAKRFGAQVSFQASAGLGVTQNAAAAEQWQLGPLPLPALINRTLMTNSKERWPYESRPHPDLVVVSLGGNDFNHQGGLVPTDAKFSHAYKDLLLDLFLKKYGPDQSTTTAADDDSSIGRPKIVSVCGQGSPDEGKDQNRCRACPHIEQAVNEFKSEDTHGLGSFVDYIFVPCDGSVVTGVDDIGCNGHKNRLGQKRVADFVEPRLREIMGWTEDVGAIEGNIAPLGRSNTTSSLRGGD